MTREKAIELLRAISQIEGYLIGVTGLKRPEVVYSNLDKIVDELVRIINAPDVIIKRIEND